jgi:hypothetical protein
LSPRATSSANHHGGHYPVCFLCSTLQLSPVFVEAPIDIVSSARLDGLIPQVCPAAVESNVIGAPRIDEVDYIRTHPSP